MLITLARKPLVGTVVQNVLTYGCGALNVDECRIPTGDKLSGGHANSGQQMTGGWHRPWMDDPFAVANNAARFREAVKKAEALGRWPANLIFVPTPDVLAPFPEVKGQVGMAKTVGGHRFIVGDTTTVQKFDHGTTDTGSAARFFKQIQGE